MTTHHRYTGHLYQLESGFELAADSYVKINGPHDTFGQVLSSSRTPSGCFLHLIRGFGSAHWLCQW